jgi:hypothetical protein
MSRILYEYHMKYKNYILLNSERDPVLIFVDKTDGFIYICQEECLK